MSKEQDPEPGARRNFTDVASLFQPIVPQADAPARAVPPPRPLPPPAVLGTEPAAAKPPAPPAPPSPPPSDPLLAPEPVASVPKPEEPSFGAAWQPQPNWRPRRSWTWILLVPLGLLGAGLVLMADPVQFRRWFNEHVWAPPPAPVPPLLATAPSRSNPPAPSELPAPVQTPTPAPAPPVSQATEPAPAPAPTAPAPPAEPGAVAPAPSSTDQSATPAQTPASAPTASPPAEAGSPSPPSSPVEPAPPPPAPLPAPPSPTPADSAPATPTFGHVSIRYRRGHSGAEAEANRLASQVQGLAERTEVRTATAGYRTPTILFFRPEDHDEAVSLGQVITAPGGAWTIRQGQRRQKPGTLEVWLPQ